MDATFTRTGETGYTTEVRRADSVELSLPAAGASSQMPHDLAHFVVEQQLGLEQGFWGCIAAGAEMRGMRVISGRRRPHARERSRSVLKSAGQRLTEAEHWVALFSRLAFAERDLRDPSTARARIDSAWRAPASRPRTIDGRQIGRVCAELRATRARWRALPVGGSLTLHWSDGSPRRSSAQRSRSRTGRR